MKASPVASTSRRPSRSTTVSDWPSTLPSRTAIRSPRGETRGACRPYPDSRRTRPTGYSSRRRPFSSRTTARCPPSGDQSAPTTSRSTSRGAPPASDRRASVSPGPEGPVVQRRVVAPQQECHLAGGGHRGHVRLGRRDLGLASSVGPARVEPEARRAVPGGRVHHRPPVRREAGRGHASVPEGEALERGDRPVPDRPARGEAQGGDGDRGRSPERAARATAAGGRRGPGR